MSQNSVHDCGYTKVLLKVYMLGQKEDSLLTYTQSKQGKRNTEGHTQVWGIWEDVPESII